MMMVKNVDVRKLSDEQKTELIKKYSNSGWVFNGDWNMSVHQWLSFTWPYDSEPEEI